MQQNKFKIGDKVKFVGDKDNDSGLVLSLSFDGEAWSYRISSREVDHEKKEVISGVKFGKEDELVAVKESNE